jgi:hypothetical protein
MRIQESTPERIPFEGVTPHIFGDFFQKLHLFLQQKDRCFPV